jgi:hypothetical protein
MLQGPRLRCPTVFAVSLSSSGQPGPLHAGPRVAVDLERLLRRPLALGHVLQVEPDPVQVLPVPASRRSANPRDQEWPHSRIPLLPAREPIHRLFLRLSPRDLNQGHRPTASAARPTRLDGGRRSDDALPALGGLHARSFARLLLVLRRPRASGRPRPRRAAIRLPFERNPHVRVPPPPDSPTRSRPVPLQPRLASPILRPLAEGRQAEGPCPGYRTPGAPPQRPLKRWTG